jgi:ABC-type dipeptide/oligopeptide/nickel transport system permease subunit
VTNTEFRTAAETPGELPVGTFNLRRAPSSDVIMLGAFVFLILLILVFSWKTPYSTTTASGQPLEPPSTRHWAGTDAVGRDLFSRILVGARLSLIAAAAVIAAGVAIGGSIGLVAGYAGGWSDSLLMRGTDLFLALPAPVLAIAVAGALGRSFTLTLVAVAVVWWPLYARIVRGEIRAIAARPHMEAARLAGGGRRTLLFRHLLPGTFAPVLVAASLDVGLMILTLAGLSFLGLGSPEPFPELGAMTSQNLSYLLTKWWIPVLPAAMIFVLAYLSNLAGDALRDVLQDS